MLVVDAAVDSRVLLTALFDDYGIKTMTATCASEALASIQQSCPDLLISEIFLPGEDGYALISKVKAFETTNDVRIPAIALTVCASESDRLQALTAGFCQHVAKPLDIDKLIATVACVTGHSARAANAYSSNL